MALGAISISAFSFVNVTCLPCTLSLAELYIVDRGWNIKMGFSWVYISCMIPSLEYGGTCECYGISLPWLCYIIWQRWRDFADIINIPNQLTLINKKVLILGGPDLIREAFQKRLQKSEAPSNSRTSLPLPLRFPPPLSSFSLFPSPLLLLPFLLSSTLSLHCF